MRARWQAVEPVLHRSSSTGLCFTVSGWEYLFRKRLDANLEFVKRGKLESEAIDLDEVTREALAGNGPWSRGIE